MKKLSYWCITLLLLTVLSALKSDSLPSVFINKLERAQMTFSMPTGYIEVPVVKNGQMNYDYAIKYPGKNFEIRYTIHPLDSVIIQYQALINSGTKMSVTPNQLYSGAFQATVLNISGGTMPNINAFPKAAVSSEFHADWGATTISDAAGDFGKGYKSCVSVALHKDNIADAYIFFLSDNGENYNDLMVPIYYSLKFK